MTDAKKEDKNIRLDYEIVLQNITDAYNSLNPIDAEIKLITDKLENSFVFSALNFFGLVGDPEEENDMSDEDLLKSSNDDLSKDALERKLKLLKQEQKDWLKDIQELQIQEQKLGAELKAQQKELDRKHKEQLRIASEKQYLADPYKFFAQVFQDADSMQQPAKLYEVARQLAAISGVVANETNREWIIKAWKIVSTARDQAFSNYNIATKGNNIIQTEKLSNINNEFYESAQMTFNNLVDKLDTGWQGLKSLYTVDPKTAEYYFINIGIPDVNIEKLRQDLDSIHLQRARRLLENTAKFKTLNEGVQKQLAQQQAYVDKLAFDLSYLKEGSKIAALEKIKKFQEKLNDNIKNAIESNKSAEEIEAEAEAIKSEINQEVSQMRRTMFKKQLAESSKIPIGAGLGLAFLFGVGVPAAVATSAMLAAAKAQLETSEDRMQVAQLEEEKKLASKLSPAQFKFLKEADKKWYAIDNKERPLNVQIKTIGEDASTLLNQGKNVLQSKYNKTITQSIDQVNIKAVKLYLGIVGTSALTLVALAVVFPATWPFFGVLAATALAGFGYVFTKKVAEPDKPAPTDLGPIADITYNFLVDARKNIAKFTAAASMQMSNFFQKTFAKPVEKRVEEATFMIPAESMQALKKLSPMLGDNFARQLIKHFQRRLGEIQDQIAYAKETHNKEAIQAIIQSTDKLEADWRKIILSSKDPKKFCQSVSEYLEEGYQEARTKFIAQERKTMTFNKHAATNVDADEAMFNMDFAADIAYERKEIDELLDLKTTVTKIIKEI